MGALKVCIVLPCKVDAGNLIHVIESEIRTGLQTRVYVNRVIGFTSSEILYQHDSCTPIYSEPFTLFNETWFLDKELAEKKCKRLLKKESIKTAPNDCTR